MCFLRRWLFQNWSLLGNWSLNLYSFDFNLIEQIPLAISNDRLVFCTFELPINDELIFVITRLWQIYHQQKMTISLLLHRKLLPIIKGTCNEHLVPNVWPPKNMLKHRDLFLLKFCFHGAFHLLIWRALRNIRILISIFFNCLSFGSFLSNRCLL